MILQIKILVFQLMESAIMISIFDELSSLEK